MVSSCKDRLFDKIGIHSLTALSLLSGNKIQIHHDLTRTLLVRSAAVALNVVRVAFILFILKKGHKNEFVTLKGAVVSNFGEKG